MPEPIAPAAEPELKDDLPANAEVLAEDNEQISQLLARFGMGPELATEEPTAEQAGKPAGQQAGEEQPAGQPAGEASGLPASGPAGLPATFTPEQETLITQRLDARAKEFEPLTAERDAALAQVEDLNAKLQAITSPAPVPREIDPLLLEDDFNAIDKQERAAEKLLAWCDDHEDAGFTPKNEDEKVWTPADIRKLRRNVEKQLNQTLPAARDLVQVRAQKRAEARKVYPELFDPKSKAFEIRQGFYRNAPWIKAVYPQFDLLLGDMIAGEKLRQTRAGQPAAAPTLPKAITAPVLPSPGGAPLPVGGAKAKARGIDVQAFIDRGGTRGALVDLIKSSGL